MKSSPRSRATSPTTNSHTYLKPGALAQIRYTRINARSKQLSAKNLIDLLQLESALSSASREEDRSSHVMDGFPCFDFRVQSYPRCLGRKKLIAVTPIFSETLS